MRPKNVTETRNRYSRLCDLRQYAAKKFARIMTMSTYSIHAKPGLDPG